MLLILLGTWLVLSAQSWFSLWIGMELNLLGFSLVIQKENTESIIIYFLIQTLMSAMLLMLSVTWSTLLVLPIIVKMGAAPMHNWLIKISQTSSFPNLTLLLTIQKLAPMSAIYLSHHPIINAFIITSAIMGSLSLINQNQPKMILAYSSVLNTAWLMSPSYFTMLLFFLSVYSVSLLYVVKIFSMSNEMTLLNPSAKLLLMINLLSMTGFPPMTGFFPKILIIDSITNSHLLIATILILSSALSLYAYMQVSNSLLLINSMSHVKSSSMLSSLGIIWPMMGIPLLMLM